MSSVVLQHVVEIQGIHVVARELLHHDRFTFQFRFNITKEVRIVNRLNKQVGIAAILGLGMVFAGVAAATTVTMTFDELNPNGEYIANYYNGGCGLSYKGSTATCGGPNLGVVWSNAVAGSNPVPFLGGVANEPTSPNVAGFVSAVRATMNVAGGFDTGLSFYYAAPSLQGLVNIYSGENGAGTLLASTFLPVTGTDCGGSSEKSSCWSPFGIAFNGIAKSVLFSGTVNRVLFDNVTLGSITPTPPVTSVPEPAALGTFGLGALLIGLFVGLRRRLG